MIIKTGTPAALRLLLAALALLAALRPSPATTTRSS